MDTVNDDDNYWNDELIERRNAELEFVSSAYNENEAWFDTNECNDDSKFSPKLGELRISKVYRKLVPTNALFHFLLILELSNKYPLEVCIHVVSRVVEKDDGGASVKDSIRKKCH